MAKNHIYIFFIWQRGVFFSCYNDFFHLMNIYVISSKKEMFNQALLCKSIKSRNHNVWRKFNFFSLGGLKMFLNPLDKKLHVENQI